MTEYRIIKKYGKLFVEVRYTGSEWNNWLFPMSTEKKPNYIFIPELNVYRRNTSI